MFSNFLADRPELKDKLFACAVFSGIAVGGMSGLNMVLTGGFDFLTPGEQIRETAPSSFVVVQPATWFNQGQETPMTSTEPLFAGQVTAVSENLAGASDDVSAASGHYPRTSDDGGDALYHQLAAQYDDQATVQSTQNVLPAVATPVSSPSTDTQSQAASDQSFNAVENQVLQAVPANLVDQKPAA